MGKKKSRADGLSKKDRRKLEEREAELRAEIARREKAAKKKGVKRSKGEKLIEKMVVEAADAGALGVITIEAEGHVDPGTPTPEEEAAAAAPVPTNDPAIVYAKSVVADLGKSDDGHPAHKHLDHVGELIEAAKGDGKKAKKAAAELAKLRAEGEARIAERDAQRAADDAALKEKVAAKKAARAKGEPVDVKAARMPDALDGESEAEYQMRKLREKREADAVEKTADAVEAIKQAVDIVETETGRVFEAGKSVAAEPDFAQPSESADMRPDFEVNGNGQYKVLRPSDGKMVGYTRVTTYIACLEDTTKLTEWKMRLLLEGVAAAEEHAERESITGKIRELAHVRDVAIAKARKADRKGKLAIGDLGALRERAWGDFKRAMNALADEVFEIGGGREKATKGTDIHALTELHDREGIGAVGDLLTAGEITPADMADVEAYAEAMRKLGAKIVERERVVVNDDLKVAGRLDIVAMVKLPALHDPKTGEVIRPAEARARRRVIDVKTGRIDYGIGKLAQQLEMYAGATGYDLETHEREDLKLDRTVGLVLHLPAGTGKATVHVVDLVAGRKGNRLAGEVRTWRNEGKRAADLRVDVLAEIARAESEAE